MFYRSGPQISVICVNYRIFYVTEACELNIHYEFFCKSLDLIFVIT